MSDHLVRGSWVWLLAVLLAVTTWARADESAPEPTLGLGLELVDFSGERQLHLFPELAGAGDGEMVRLGQLASAPSSNPPPGLDPPIPLTLTPVMTFDLADPGKTELRLFRVDRKTWDELDTWEKIGLVTSYASAVAGMVGLALEAVD